MTDIETHFLHQTNLLDGSLHLTEEQLRKLHIYYENLIEWNKHINLTAITEESDVYTKHFLDSLSIFQIVPRETFKKRSIIDIGTGAGLPGIPLAIVMPETNVTLMDSLGKRIRFLENLSNQLGLINVSCIHARAEDLARDKKYRDKYDCVVSRAVSNLSTLSEYCIPFIHEGGLFVAYKSEKTMESEEWTRGIKAADKLGAQVINQKRFMLPDTDYARVLILFEKQRTTPDKYPRKAGVPSRDPLK